MKLKGNKIGPLVEIQIDLETITQSEVNQEEKNKYHILTHIGGIQRSGTAEPTCKAERETQMHKTNVWTPRRGSQGGMN